MKIAITGHLDIEKSFNIKQEDNHVYNKEVFNKVFNKIEDFLLMYIETNRIDTNDLYLISGMARGVDEIFALIAIKHKYKLIIAVPKSIEYHKNKIVKKTPDIKIQAIQYEEILKYENLEICEVSNNIAKERGDYGYFITRNQVMVDLSDYVLSFKRYESTGTNDCIDRAIKNKKYLGNIS
jgi:hypothetical protein